MNKKLIIPVLVVFVAVTVFFIIRNQSNDTSNATGDNQSTSDSVTDKEVSGSNVGTSSAITGTYSSDELDDSFDTKTASTIILNGNTISLNGTGATVNGSIVTITSAGTYIISGTLNDGQIIVNANDNASVKLVLNNATIKCTTSSPIFVKNADKTIITIASGTTNTLIDTTNYILDSEGEPTATIFSKDDLIINGTGNLTINANYNDAIKSNDDLKIVNGNITITSVDDGIIGKDSVFVKNGTITIKAGGDGIKSTNDTKDYKGYVVIDGGKINVTASADGIQAVTNVTVNSGNLNVTTGGGSSTKISSTSSAKGIKCGQYIFIVNGEITIDAADDSVHSNQDITINNGTLILSTGDDGIHADTNLTINNGNITIKNSYEGLEATNITINEGTIYIKASDDGLNAANGDGSGAQGPMGKDRISSSSGKLLINGGYIYIDSTGDGLDSNGTLSLSGGTIIVNGPTDNGNGAIDYDGSFDITGGFIVAVGSSGMAEAASNASIYGAKINFSTSLSASTLVHIEDNNGNNILTFAPAKKYQSVVVYSTNFKKNTTYNIYTGGSCTGSVKDGLYTGGTYTSGTLYTSFTTSSYTTSIGNNQGTTGGNKR